MIAETSSPKFAIVDAVCFSATFLAVDGDIDLHTSVLKAGINLGSHFEMVVSLVLTPSDAYRCLVVRGRTPSLPAGLRVYAIGDIHGRVDLLDRLLALTNADDARRPLTRSIYVFLGDYIDRGPSSRETIDRLIAHGAGRETVFLKGNHELIAMQSLSDPAIFEQWMRLGGGETLASYHVAKQHHEPAKQTARLQAAFHDALPQAHFRFFKDLQTSFACGDFFFVHAGVRPGVDLSQQQDRDLLWIRNEFLTSSEDFGKIIVHGHTPIKDVEIKPNRVNIDTGAVASGCLTCLVLENGFLSVIDTLM